MSKIELIILAIALSLLIWSGLIWAVNKCSEPTTRNIIWGITITLYAVFPVSVAIGELMNLYRSQVVAEAEEKLRDEKISYEDMVEALLRAGYPEDYLLTYMLCLNRIDFAERCIRENPQATYQNLPDIMYRYYSANKMDDAKRVQMLIERGAHLSEEYGDSLLYTAVKGNNTGIVKMLLDAGAKPHSNESLFPLVDKQTNPELWSLLAPKTNKHICPDI